MNDPAEIIQKRPFRIQKASEINNRVAISKIQ
jgi:hypothetical protein